MKNEPNRTINIHLTFYSLRRRSSRSAGIFGLCFDFHDSYGEFSIH
ncbi:hypothetical protein JYT18_01170 [Desulfocapsa sp. AH-315-J15]|nr:hypothetical protein [Desulfocapsa sp. AH-315-J15]